jgi:cytochrome c oxidase cbb3-type subunit 2
MKNLPLLFCGILGALALSFMGLILSSYHQLGSLTQTTEVLDESGNPSAGDPLYPPMMTGAAQQGKAVYVDLGCVYCHTQQVRRAGYGSDIEREWGQRQTVARDYITQGTVTLGNQRVGPDLMTIGDRKSVANWHHLHLYNPRITSNGLSIMPEYSFLYETREIEGVAASANALQFDKGSAYAPAAGYEIVPTQRAEALVEYLLSLQLNYSLPEAQISE